MHRFFESERPDYVFIAAGRVGGIYANNTYPAEFVYQNLMIESNIIHAAYGEIRRRSCYSSDRAASIRNTRRSR